MPEHFGGLIVGHTACTLRMAPAMGSCSDIEIKLGSGTSLKKTWLCCGMIWMMPTFIVILCLSKYIPFRGFPYI